MHLRGGGEWSLHLDLGSGAAARRGFALLRGEGLRSEIRTYQRRAFDRATRYQLHVAGEMAALRVLVAAGVLDSRRAPLSRPPRRVVARACCRTAYLRGAFLGGGSISVKRAPHLELRTASVEAAIALRDVAKRAGITLAVRERATHAAAYAKGWDAIESVLAAMGAAETVLVLEERAVVAATSAQANRLANADHSNVVRTSRTSQLQLEAIRSIRAERGLEGLPTTLREVAELRLRHPADSLRELAARTDPPATKAAVHRRLRRLQDLVAG